MDSRFPTAVGPRRASGAIALLLALAAPLSAAVADTVGPDSAAPGIPEVARAGGPLARLYAIPETTAEITVDAKLDEPAWEEAAVIRLDYETRPGENTPAPVETECLVTHSRSHLYVAFRAHDDDPSTIRARLTDRDTAFNDDFVGVVLDTFNDERRGFEFFVNPLGVQMDLFQDDVGGTESSSWDAIWDSAGRITESGFLVEMAIPFHQLRFPSTAESQTWGFDALRFRPRSQRVRMSSQPMDRDKDCYLCQISKIEGFEGITPGRNLEIAPTLTASESERREAFPDGDFTGSGVDSDPGITVRWGVTPNMTLSGTINPDFSQVEADVAQLDVNNQFAIFFPERRPFFLEGADFFDSPMNLVFTRNVADPEWGLKLTGKEGKNAYGVFAAQDSLTNLIFPGSQGSASGSFDFDTLDSVLRYRRDFGQNSAVGLMVTSREGDGYSNRVAGVDGLYRATDTDSFRFQLLQSETEYPLAIVDDFDQPAGGFSDTAFTLRYNHDSRNLDIWGQYTDVGDGFRADMGFMPRVDYSFILGGASWTWWGDEEDWYTQWRVGGDYDITEDGAGNVLEREFEVWQEFGGPKQSWLWTGVGTRDRFFNGVNFEDQSFFSFYTQVQPNRVYRLELFGHTSDAIDFANTREGDLVQLEPSLRLELGRRLRANLSHVYQKLDVEGGELFAANLTRLRVVWQFNVRSFVRTVLQYRQIDRDPTLYNFEIDPESQSLTSQLLYSYKINPQTVLFLGYSDARLGGREIDGQLLDLTQRDRTLFLKIGYAWNL